MRTHADIRKAKEILNYHPSISIEKGIKLFAEWFRENHENLNVVE
jgi:nucleoside-diphosphate-sugar epimerase